MEIQEKAWVNQIPGTKAQDDDFICVICLEPMNEVNSSAISQMPRHLISDAHEWINEIPTVPIYYLAKPQPRERAWQNQRGKKTLLSLTLVRLCEKT